MALSGLEGRRPDRIPAEAAAGVGRQQQRKGQESQAGAQGGQKELKEAKKELKEAEQKYEAKASVQAGREQAGASAYAVVAVAFGLQRSRMVVVRFRAVQPFLLFGVMLSSQQGFRSSLSFTVLACTSGSGRGSWLLQVQANLVALRVLPMLQNGVSVLGSRLGGQPALCSLCPRFALVLQVAVVFV